jgi:hypothetical protein
MKHVPASGQLPAGAGLYFTFLPSTYLIEEALPMTLLSREELRTLATATHHPCVSIFLPTHRTGHELRQDPIRLKNLLGQAEERLQERGLRGPEARTLLEPARQLLSDEPFWHQQSDAMALFLARGFFRQYRLPLAVQELVAINSRFVLKPLVPLLGDDGLFYVLSLSQKKVQLFTGSRYNFREVDLKTLPQNLAEALQIESSDYETQRQFYNRGIGGGGSQPARSHGHGAGREEHKEHLQRFFRVIDQGLHVLLKDKQYPLVLAGVEYYLPLYREINTYNHLVDGMVAGNHGMDNPGELHRQAWKVVEPLIARPRQQAIKQYLEWSGTDKTTRDLGQILPAANQGRLAVLFVSPTRHCWGRYDRQTGAIQQLDRSKPESEDLYDLAAVQTFLTGGKVYSTDNEGVLNEKIAVAATYRY